MATTSSRAMISVWKMSRMPAPMLCVPSTMTVASIPSGKRSERRATVAFTALPTATALLPGCW